MKKKDTIVRELVRELAYREMDETTIRSVILGLDTVNHYKQMIKWLREVNNPTKNDIMLKVYLITEEEGE